MTRIRVVLAEDHVLLREGISRLVATNDDMEPGARRVLLLHHKPDRTDTELDKQAAGLRDSRVPVTLAADGEVISL